MTLFDAEINKNLIVLSIDKDKHSDVSKLTSMGVLPGVRLKVTQKKPLIAFEIGYSRFAIDKTLAKLIEVEVKQ